MRKDKKGFTLIEIIAVLVIVAILAVLIVPSVTKYMNRGKNEYNTKLEQQLEVVGKDYYSANPKELPVKAPSMAKPLWLANLKSSNYTSEEFVDADGGKCIKSYVQVKKTDTGYEYTPCLVCDNYKSENAACTVDVNQFDVTDDGVVDEPESNPPTCKIELSNKTGNWTNGDVTATITYESDKENGRTIAGLSVDGVAITEGVSVGATNGTYTYKVTKSGYNKKVSATVMDDLGYSQGYCESAQEVKIDKTGPVCMFSDPYKGDATWESSSYPRRGETVYYDLTCSDSESKSVVTPLATVVSKISVSNLEPGATSLRNVTGVSTTTGTNGTIYKLKATGNDTGPARLNLASGVVKDAAGNAAGDAESPAVYVWNPTTGGGGGELPDIDTSVPSCTVVMTKADGTIYNEGEWSNQDVTVTATCTPTANIRYTPSRTITNEGETTVYITASNIYNSSNSTSFTRHIKIDKTKPTCNVIMRKYRGYSDNPTYDGDYENNHWTQRAVRVDLDCSDTGGSGLNESNSATYMTKTGGTKNYGVYLAVTDEGISTVNIYARDNAGNEMTPKTKTVKRDTIAPTLTFERSGNTIRAVCRDGDGKGNLNNMSITRFQAQQYQGPNDGLYEYIEGRGYSMMDREKDLYDTHDVTYMVAGCTDAALNGKWIQSKFTKSTYTKTVSEKEYFWSAQNSGSGNCNSDINCCSTSSGRICNSSNHGNYRYKSCSSSSSIVDYTYSYAWETIDSATITTSGSTSQCKSAVGTATYQNCSSYSCNSSREGDSCRLVSGKRCYKKRCTSSSTPVYGTKYRFGVKNQCLYRTNDTKTTKNLTSCTPGTSEVSNGSDGTYIRTTTCTETPGSETKMTIEDGN